MALLNQQKGLTSEILAQMEIDQAELRRKIETVLEQSPSIGYESPQVYATPNVIQLLQSATSEAKRLNDEFVSIEHILIAIAGDRKSQASQILQSAGIDQEGRTLHLR